MKLTWLGHACFAVEQDGYRIIIDPYIKVVGHPDVQTEGHAVLCSHQHFDHNAKEGVALLPQRENPFAVRTVETCHDDQGGALRGPNTIHVLSAGGVTVAHLGDLGHPLTEQQLAELGAVDGILIPVGGTYTLDAAEAREVCRAVNPKWVVPMHYRHGSCGFAELLEVEDFLRLWDEAQVHRCAGAELELLPETAGVQVLRCGD